MSTMSRRSFLALSAALPFAIAAKSHAEIPVGLELYSVRDHLKTDPFGTVRTVGGMGYKVVEFYAPYFEWSDTQTKQMRALLDDLGVRCFSTHNDAKYLEPTNINRTRDMNLTLGSRYVVQAWAEPPKSIDEVKTTADKLTHAAETLKPSGLNVGYHNHEAEFHPVDGQRPMEIIARNTSPTIALQLDVGTCLKAGADPVAWIRSNPGRIRSLHLKDWSPDPDKGFNVIFGQGSAPWKQIFDAAESVGGVEYYLIEQEMGGGAEFDTVRRCLEAYRKVH